MSILVQLDKYVKLRKNGGLEVIKSNDLPERGEEIGEIDKEKMHRTFFQRIRILS